jgi:glycosyltransferase involved in cell wall biosynthesis
MKISVIIPTYNRPLQLKQAFHSVCNQTRKPEEIIIIDDASDLNNKIIVENFVCEGVILKIERIEVSKGACHARNRGAELASGDILMFLDDDDTWEPNKIASQINVFAQNHHIGLVYSGRLVVSDINREKIIYKIQPKASGNLYPQILYDNLIGTTSSVAIKKSLFKEVGGFDEELPAFQDYDLWIRCCQITIVGHDDSFNVNYTLSTNPSSQISGQSERHIVAVSKILEKYKLEIASQGFLNTRKIRSSKFFSVAKSLRNRGIKESIKWIYLSFIQYPNLKTIALILPIRTTRILQKLKSQFVG